MVWAAMVISKAELNYIATGVHFRSLINSGTGQVNRPYRMTGCRKIEGSLYCTDTTRIPRFISPYEHGAFFETKKSRGGHGVKIRFAETKQRACRDHFEFLLVYTEPHEEVGDEWVSGGWVLIRRPFENKRIKMDVGLGVVLCT